MIVYFSPPSHNFTKMVTGFASLSLQKHRDISNVIGPF